MMGPAWRLAARSLALLGLLALGACAGGEGACTLRPVATLPMASGVPVPIVPVRIDGHDAAMVFDTGSQAVILAQGAARRLGLRADPRRGGSARGIGGATRQLGATLRSLSLDQVTLHQVPAGVLTQDLPVANGVAVDGLLGMSVLNHYDIMLDMPARRAVLYDGTACHASPPHWTGMQRIEARSLGGRFIIPVVLDGRTLHAMIDSGAQGNVLFTDARGIAFARRHQLRGQDLHGVGPSEAHAFVAEFARLEVGRETLRAVPMVVTRRLPGAPDVILGQPFLEHHRVWFSAQRGALFVAPAPG